MRLFCQYIKSLDNRKLFDSFVFVRRSKSDMSKGTDLHLSCWYIGFLNYTPRLLKQIPSRRWFNALPEVQVLVVSE